MARKARVKSPPTLFSMSKSTSVFAAEGPILDTALLDKDGELQALRQIPTGYIRKRPDY